MREKLKEMTVHADAGEGLVKVEADATGEITNISISKEAVDLDDLEQLEDLTLIAINRVLELAKEKEAIETQKLMRDMMPPGLGDMGNLFGG